jgi:glucokinase-like ROK family protein
LTLLNNMPTSIDVKLSNKHLALDLVRYTSGGISRADLARQLGLSRAAMSSIVGDFLRLEMTRESENSPTNRGRRPVLLEINPNFGYVVGVDVGATHVSLNLADFSANILNASEFSFDVSKGPLVCLAEIDEMLRSFLAENGMDFPDLLAIGVGVPGPVVVELGAVVAPPIMPGWDRFPIQRHLENLWGCPVILGNDAELGALGEWAYGAGRNEQHLLFVKVGYGIGAGLLLDGQIYRGATGCAGEIGHITVDENGPICTCGNRGCLEAFSGGRSIAQRAAKAIQSGRRTQLSNIPIEKITASDVALYARKGDLVAQEIVAQAGEYLGTALASLINILNPGMIIIGGSVSQMGDLFLEPIRQAATKRSLPVFSQSVRITAAYLGQRSSAIGAVTQALTLVAYQALEGNIPVKN